MPTITRRPPTAREQAALIRATKADSASWGCIVAFTVVAMLGTAAFGALVGAFKGMVLQRAAAASTLGLLLGVIFAVQYWNHERRRRRSAQLDAEGMMIEEIVAECSEAVQCVPACDDADDPSFCLDIGDGKLLLLRGQWLMDPERLGATQAHDRGEDEEADTANFLAEPYSFPRTKVTVRRAPHTGDVLAIELAGRYLPPSRVVDVLARDYEIEECALLEGSLASLAADIERHYRAESG